MRLDGMIDPTILGCLMKPLQELPARARRSPVAPPLEAARVLDRSRWRCWTSSAPSGGGSKEGGALANAWRLASAADAAAVPRRAEPLIRQGEPIVRDEALIPRVILGPQHAGKDEADPAHRPHRVALQRLLDALIFLEHLGRHRGAGFLQPGLEVGHRHLRPRRARGGARSGRRGAPDPRGRRR